MGATVAETDRAPTRIEPDDLGPSPACEQGLCQADAELLERVLSIKHEYIDDPRLHEANVEHALFEDDFDDGFVKAQSVGQCKTVPTRFVKMQPEQEQHAFLRYNYARKRVVELLAARKPGSTVGLALAREILRWYRRVLALRTGIVNSSFPLVLAMAKHSRFASMDMNEMISEGNMALLRSIDKFDLTKGYRFSSYACRSILKAYSRVAHRIGRYRSQFPTEYEESLERSDQVETAREAQHQDFLDELDAVLRSNAAHLNDVERRVIMERFAVHHDRRQTPEPKTLGEVGEMIGLTKERVRQIQNRALEKLRIAMSNRFAAA